MQSGTITPLGPLGSEGAKALLSRRNIPASAAFSSVILENIFYSISVAIMIMVGTLAFLLGYRPTNTALTISLALGVVAIVALLAVWWLLNSQPRLLSRFLTHVGGARRRRPSVSICERHGRNAWRRYLLLDFLFHAAAVLEIYFLLTVLVGHNDRNLLNALILGTAERLIMVAFKFVPLRLGVDHIGAGSVAGLIGIGAATGITIATVRTARNLFWAAVGLMLLAGSGSGQTKGLPKSAGPAGGSTGTMDDRRSTSFPPRLSSRDPA